MFCHFFGRKRPNRLAQIIHPVRADMSGAEIFILQALIEDDPDDRRDDRGVIARVGLQEDIRIARRFVIARIDDDQLQSTRFCLFEQARWIDIDNPARLMRPDERCVNRSSRNEA